MRLGIAIEETWDFFHEVYADLRAHHDTTLYERRPIRIPLVGPRLPSLAFALCFVELPVLLRFEVLSQQFGCL